MSGSNDDIDEVKEIILQELGDTVDISTARPIARPAGKERIKDATFAAFVNGRNSSDDIVILLSNPDFPDAVREDTDSARSVLALVSPAVGRHIITPLTEGRHEGRTYAVFHRLSPVSDLKVPRFLQKVSVSRRVVSWLKSLAFDTRTIPQGTAQYSSSFMDPLEFLCSTHDMPDDARRLAERCGEFVQGTRPELFTSVQHGDFWIGNILFERRAFPGINPLVGEFLVIDWRGADIHGYPCMDLLRFCLSAFRNGSAQTRRLLSSYRNRLKISELEMSTYCLLSLGRLGMNLDQFPRERYLEMCRNVHSFLEVHGLTASRKN